MTDKEIEIKARISEGAYELLTAIMNHERMNMNDVIEAAITEYFLNHGPFLIEPKRKRKKKNKKRTRNKADVLLI